MYLKIKEVILHEINSGNWSPGQRIMSEEEFAIKFNVSRMTSRHALVELEREGILVRFRALGTFVAQTKVQRNLDRLLTFAEAARVRGQEPEVRTLAFLIKPVDGAIAEIINLQPSELVINLEQLHIVDHSPLAILNLYMPQSLCPGIKVEDFERIDYYDFLERQYGIMNVHADLTIEAIIANKDQAEKLQVTRGFPLFQTSRVYYTQRLGPIWYSVTFIRSDKYSFRGILKR